VSLGIFSGSPDKKIADQSKDKEFLEEISFHLLQNFIWFLSTT